ncbi:MAG: hypothetical protein ACRD0A_04490 [Acidimicrobiales bacterium]
MALITVAGSKASPGATTLAMGLAANWPATAGRRLVVVEADPAGGVLAARYEALRGERTLADATLMLRRGFRVEDMVGSSRRLWGWLPVVVSPIPPRQAYEALARRESAVGPPAAERLAAGLAGCPDVDVLVDIGRVTPQSPALPFIEHAEVTLLVTRLGFESVAATLALIDDLAGVVGRGGLVLVGVGTGPYDAATVASEAGVAGVAELPWDETAAATIRHGVVKQGRLRRSALWRDLGDFAARLATAAGPAPAGSGTQDGNGHRPGPLPTGGVTPPAPTHLVPSPPPGAGPGWAAPGSAR